MSMLDPSIKCPDPWMERKYRRDFFKGAWKLLKKTTTRRSRRNVVQVLATELQDLTSYTHHE